MLAHTHPLGKQAQALTWGPLSSDLGPTVQCPECYPGQTYLHTQGSSKGFPPIPPHLHLRQGQWSSHSFLPPSRGGQVHTWPRVFLSNRALDGLWMIDQVSPLLGH